MADAVAISDQSVADAAEIEQAIAVGIVARHSGNFEAEYKADLFTPGTVYSPIQYQPGP